MGIIRGKVYTDFDYHPNNAVIGGDWPFIECDCGKWLDPKTGQHAESISLQELLDREVEKPKCPDAEKPISRVEDKT